MLVGEREEGRFPGTAKDPTSSLPQDPWDLTHGQAGGAGVGKCRVCVWGVMSGEPEDADVEEKDTQERSWRQGDGQFQWWGQG